MLIDKNMHLVSSFLFFGAYFNLDAEREPHVCVECGLSIVTERVSTGEEKNVK